MTTMQTLVVTKNTADPEFMLLPADAARSCVQLVAGGYIAVAEAPGIITGGNGGLVYRTGDQDIPLVLRTNGPIWVQAFADGTVIRLIIERTEKP